MSGLAAASLGGVPNARATCIGISGINIGDGCDSTFGNFALVLGTGTAETSGFFTAAIGTGTDVTASSGGLGTLAYAGGAGTLAVTEGILNLAVAGLGFEGPLGVGTNVVAFAGARPLDFVNIAVNIGSADDAFDTVDGATSGVEASDGAFNLAGNLFGNANSLGSVPTPLTVLAGGDDETLGFGTVAANVFGNRNHVEAICTLVNATNWGNAFTFPNGSDSTVTAGTLGSPTSLSWAFNYQGIFTEACEGACGNIVNATGPGAIAGALGVVQRDVSQDTPGITLATQLNSTASTTNVLAAGGTQANRVRLNSTGSNTDVLAAGKPNKFTPTTFATGTADRAGSQLSGSLTKAGKQFSSSLNQISSSLSKRVSDNVQNALGGFGKKKQQNSDPGSDGGTGGDS